MSTLPKSELEVVQIVWKLKKASVREVTDSLIEIRDVDFWTIQTHLRRLTEKGYLQVRRTGRNNIYSPLIKPKTVIRETVDAFVAQMFYGDALPLIQHLIGEKTLSTEDIKQLQQNLDTLKENERD